MHGNSTALHEPAPRETGDHLGQRPPHYLAGSDNIVNAGQMPRAAMIALSLGYPHSVNALCPTTLSRALPAGPERAAYLISSLETIMAKRHDNPSEQLRALDLLKLS